MKMAQEPGKKEQAITEKNRKIDVLVAFKLAYPNAIINFNEPAIAEEVVEVIEEPTITTTTGEIMTVSEFETLKAQAIQDEVEAKAKAKAIKKAELEAELKALDES